MAASGQWTQFSFSGFNPYFNPSLVYKWRKWEWKQKFCTCTNKCVEGQNHLDARARIGEKSASSQAKISSWAPPTPSSADVQGNLRKAWCGYKLVLIWVRIREKSATSRWMDQRPFWHFFACRSAFFLLINLHFLAPGPVHRLHIFCT